MKHTQHGPHGVVACDCKLFQCVCAHLWLCAWQVGIENMSQQKNRIKEMLEARAAKNAQAARDGSSTSVHSEQKAHIGDLSHSRASVTLAAPQANVGPVATTTSNTSAAAKQGAPSPANGAAAAAAAVSPASPAAAASPTGTLRGAVMSMGAPPPAVGSPALMSPLPQGPVTKSPSPKKNFENLCNLPVMLL